MALARFAQSKLPDDRAFQAYPITDIGGVVAALEKAGVGFGKRAAPGKLYEFAPPPASAVVTLANNAPA
ncbi:MAG: hypothetical protein ACRDL5_08430 [Solirubrobacteraceae bacterium]